MKNLFCSIVLTVAVYSAAGQGTVNFSAGATAASRVSTNSVIGGGVSGQTGSASAGYAYFYALFVADSTITSAGTPTATGALDPSLTPGWSQAIWSSGNPAGVVGAVYATNSFSGRFTGNPTTDDVLIAGRATGSSASFIIVGWSSQVAGMDWASAKAWIDVVIQQGEGPSVGWTGASGVATSVQLGGGTTPVGGMFGTSPGQISSAMVLQLQVPEPGTFTVAALGAVVLVIFRRRRN